MLVHFTSIENFEKIFNDQKIKPMTAGVTKDSFNPFEKAIFAFDIDMDNFARPDFFTEDIAIVLPEKIEKKIKGLGKVWINRWVEYYIFEPVNLKDCKVLKTDRFKNLKFKSSNKQLTEFLKKTDTITPKHHFFDYYVDKFKIPD